MAPMDGSNLNTGQSLDDSLTAFSGANATFIAEIYERYLQDPTSVDPDWQVFFEAFDDEPQAYQVTSMDLVGRSVGIQSLTVRSRPLKARQKTFRLH